MMKKIFLVIIFILTKILTAQNSLGDTIDVKDLRNADVSIIQLIANPKTYDGSKVRLIGYLHIKFEDCAIYLTKTDADYLNGTNALWVNFNDNVNTRSLDAGDNIKLLNYFDCKYVRIIGVFNMNKRGHLGLFAGTIDSVESIAEERQWYDGVRELREDKLDGKGLVPKK